MSEIRVDTISEKTSANGVSIDGVTIKDGGGTFTSPVLVPDGSTSAVSLGNDGDPNTGIYFQAADSLGLVLGGSRKLSASSTGIAIENGTLSAKGGAVFNEDSADVDFRVETNDNSKMFFVDGGNDAVIFNGNSSDYEASSQMVQIHNSGLHFSSGYGIQGGVNADRASINLTSGSGGNVLFKVNNSEVARFTSGGLAIGGTGAANTLDDYEEGTYTPTVDDENGGSYGLASGGDLLQYTKIGRKVTLQGMISVTSESSPNGTVRLSLPFTAPSLTDDSDYALYAMGLANNGSTIAGQKFLFVQPGSYAFLYAIGDDGATNYIGHDEVDTAFQFHVNLSYVVS